MRIPLLRPAVLLTILATAACGGGASNTQQLQASNTNAPAASRSNASADKNSYPVFPDVDAGADPAVPADQGGKGFKGDGWQTNTTFDLIGDPRAVKGGTIRDHMGDFPNTLRIAGPGQSVTNGFLFPTFMYETLLGMHPTTLNRDLKPLRAQGLMADATDASDRRARALVITAKGRARLRKAIPHWRRAQARLEGALGAGLARALTDLLDSASTKLQSEGPP